MSTQTAVRPSEIAMFDRPAETMPREALGALQLRRLRETLALVYASVPHYRRKFDAAGVTPDDLKTLADIARFPLTLKSDLRDNYPFSLFAVPREHLLRLHASSGTTGKPTVVGYSQRDLDTWAGLMAPPCVRPAASRACWCRTRTAMGCSPAALVFTTGPSGSA